LFRVRAQVAALPILVLAPRAGRHLTPGLWPYEHVTLRDS
jgi:hypothetical protein